MDSAGDHHIRQYVAFIPFYPAFFPPVRRLMMSRGAASFTIYSGTKESFRDARVLNRDSLLDVSLLGGIGSDPDRPPEPQNANIRLQGRVGGIGHLVWVGPIRARQGLVIVSRQRIPNVLMTSPSFPPRRAMMTVGPTSARVLDRRREGAPHFPASWHSRRRPRHHEDPRSVWAVHRI